ncbi:MAG: hypothetical protein WKF71_13040 [Pyrinomonadaceae bacterium]
MSAVHRHEIDVGVNQQIAFDGAFVDAKRLVVARMSDGYEIFVVFRVVVVITVWIKFVKNLACRPFAPFPTPSSGDASEIAIIR